MINLEPSRNTDIACDHDWEALALLDGAARERYMTSIYCQLVMVDDDERVARLRPMVQSEFFLSQEELRDFTASRLASWLSLHRDDAVVISAAYHRVIQEMPDTISRWQALTVQLVLKEFDPEARCRLEQLIDRGVWDDATLRSEPEAQAVDALMFAESYADASVWPFAGELR